MNADEHELTRKRKLTSAVLCLVAGAIIIVAAVLPGWIKSDARVGMAASLYGFEWCSERAPDLTKKDDPRDDDAGTCQQVSNRQFATWTEWQGLKASGIWGLTGWVTLGLSIVAGLALAAAGALGLKDRFVRDPIALTTVALVAGSLAIISACVFVATKPGYVPRLGPILGLSWPFFMFGVGIVTGLAGAQMLARAHSDVRDPYWDGLVPEPAAPGLPPMQDHDQNP